MYMYLKKYMCICMYIMNVLCTSILSSDLCEDVLSVWCRCGLTFNNSDLCDCVLAVGVEVSR